jgi:UDP-N-acetylmuramyl pentapeptide phosphotransferase/UDP-N-acetylglucosamine-1-phosphate transferase
MINFAILTILLFTSTLAASWLGVALFRRWSLARDLLDVPNERSSHSAPTPRGGGLVIVLVCLLGYLAIHLIFAVPFSKGYFIGALMVAVVSWLDDLYSLPFWSRLMVHVTAAGVLVAELGVWQGAVLYPSLEVNFGMVLGGILTIGWVVWLLNAYNFMDGIDGIAALQAVVTGVAWAIFGLYFHLQGSFLFAGVVACVSLGFLLHNWQPAKIFMGDVGSAFLGFTLAAMPLLFGAETQQRIAVLPTIAVLFVWFFVFDTIFTLLRRAVNRERVWEAHRSHLYQRMVISGLSHRDVTLIYALAAALLAASALLAVIFKGNYGILSLFLLVILTAGQVFLGLRKKR